MEDPRYSEVQRERISSQYIDTNLQFPDPGKKNPQIPFAVDFVTLGLSLSHATVM